MEYQDEAKKIINLLKDFDKKDFEKWYYDNLLIIGSNNIFQYLDEKKRWNLTCKLSGSIIYNVKISNQAKAVLRYLPDIDMEDLKIWFINSVSVNKKNIIMYLEFRQMQLNHLIKRGDNHGK